MGNIAKNSGEWLKMWVIKMGNFHKKVWNNENVYNCLKSRNNANWERNFKQIVKFSMRDFAKNMVTVKYERFLIFKLGILNVNHYHCVIKQLRSNFSVGGPHGSQPPSIMRHVAKFINYTYYCRLVY